jgi:hypothetical protein
VKPSLAVRHEDAVDSPSQAASRSSARPLETVALCKGLTDSSTNQFRDFHLESEV